ncbi:MAG: hypothetical protein ACOCRN_04175 [Spirochaetia bacterium]
MRDLLRIPFQLFRLRENDSGVYQPGELGVELIESTQHALTALDRACFHHRFHPGKRFMENSVKIGGLRALVLHLC